MKTLFHPKFAVAFVVLAFATISSGLSAGAYASPYHQDVLPNGAVTGPIAPNANGG